MPERLSPTGELERRYAEEMAQSAPAAAVACAEAIRRRHGPAVSAILFYGSCLRRGSDEGVLDLIAVVDRYREAYPTRVLAVANSLLPPNVFYLEESDSADPRSRGWRAKYAVFSLADLRRHAKQSAPQAFVWARLCQPTRLVYARDAAARRDVAAAAATAARTAVETFAPLFPPVGEVARFTPEELWCRVFRETYRAEWRVEGARTARSLFAFAPAHYERAGRLILGPPGAVRGELELRLAPWRRRRARLGWAGRRFRSKVLAVPRLLKSAVTFGDWVPYALWKLETHRGIRIEPTPRQRRHPFVWGWPVLLRILRERQLR